MSATEFYCWAAVLAAAWLWFVLSMRAAGWRRCVKCRVWWHRTQPRVTYLNQPDECDTALPGKCRHCRGGAK